MIPTALCLRVILQTRIAIFLRFLLVAVMLSHTPGALSQESKAKPLPSTPPDDTDWTYYCDSSHKVEPTDRLKCIGGKVGSKRQLSVSGELRQRGEYFDHISLGEASPSSGYLLQRYILNTDLVLGDRLRLFTSLECALVFSRLRTSFD